MSVSEVSKRYAKAVYEMAKANGTVEKVLNEIRAIKQVLETDKAIHDFFSTPMVAPEQKTAAIKAAFSGKLSIETVNTLTLLAEKNRLLIFEDLVSAFEMISDLDHGVMRGQVRSAATLSPESRKNIEDIVAKVTKQKVILNFTEDKSLLGGMVAQVGGWTFDDSLESHLKRINEDLNRRAN